MNQKIKATMVKQVPASCQLYQSRLLLHQWSQSAKGKKEKKKMSWLGDHKHLIFQESVYVEINMKTRQAYSPDSGRKSCDIKSIAKEKLEPECIIKVIQVWKCEKLAIWIISDMQGNSCMEESMSVIQRFGLQNY